jgi:hypothetical protein
MWTIWKGYFEISLGLMGSFLFDGDLSTHVLQALHFCWMSDDMRGHQIDFLALAFIFSGLAWSRTK